MQKSNINLKEDLKSLAYSNDVQKEVLVKENKGAKKDNDYEYTKRTDLRGQIIIG